MDTNVSRRGLMVAGSIAASLTAAGAVAGRAVAAARGPVTDGDVASRLADPATRARVQARVRGSCGRETIPIFYRLDLYGYTGEGNLVPYFTLNHLSVNEWRPLPNDEYEAKTFECGAYCKFGTDEALDTWTNPITGETREVFHFLGGPFTVVTGANGIRAMGAELTPHPARMEAFGGTFFLTSSASMARPNPTAAKDHPELYSGKVSYWDTISTVTCSTKAAFDDTLSSAPAVCHFQNMGSWHPWLGMGQKPGRTYGRAAGTKLRSIDEIPAAARKTLEAKTPQIFDRANWTTPLMDIPEYIRSLDKR
ncbi:DUF1838 family protein [Novosphingobium sp. Leaf2]|uniref:DUF1838 family protein n=1 Tax=Novosphingobium sp. Leaf2 TaxID=1735670 RepID=UPI0006F3A01B|nr:DUF1838 family protein [Novosphingobium sp. Leaf2]KQM13326.1 hypothetical protein ASE49_12910 [Novosphingobium sp. Leaf2]